MNDEKYKNEANRWYMQAQKDIEAAQNSFNTKNYEWACFQSQQAGEKILKALWLFYGFDPWGHSIFKLILDFPNKGVYKQTLGDIVTEAQLLDKLYIPTRYPNGLPDLIPYEAYNEQDAMNAIKAVKIILNRIEKHLEFI